jgi:beta-xylosidase
MAADGDATATDAETDGPSGPDESAAASEAGATGTYTNPVIASDFPDPFILRQGARYYAFATNAGGSNIQSATSTDLATWTVLPDALPSLPAWASPSAGLTWAPSILQRGPSTFVMYYTTRDAASGFQCISHAVASSPAGPYVDSSASAFVCQVSGAQSLCGSIDPSPFVDYDGTAYLVWKSDENASQCAQPPRLWSAALSSDGTGLAGPATELLEMDRSWQQPIIEGPSMRLVSGTYYLVYSANNYESASYAMGYARCLSPVGPCENVSIGGPFVSSAGSALGPGGGEFFDDPLGGLRLVYHAWTAPKTTYAGGGARSMRIDRLSVSDAGILSLEGPTTTPQPL